MPAVSDTSPLIGLAAIFHLELLHDQFGLIFIPQAVYAEFSVVDAGIRAGFLQEILSGFVVMPKHAYGVVVINKNGEATCGVGCGRGERRNILRLPSTVRQNNLPRDLRAKGEFYGFVDECHRTTSNEIYLVPCPRTNQTREINPARLPAFSRR